jgi:hypothetical protein
MPACLDQLVDSCCQRGCGRIEPVNDGCTEPNIEQTFARQLLECLLGHAFTELQRPSDSRRVPIVRAIVMKKQEDLELFDAIKAPLDKSPDAEWKGATGIGNDRQSSDIVPSHPDVAKLASRRILRAYASAAARVPWRSTTVPMMAAMTEPARMPSFAESSRVGLANARVAMNSDIVRTTRHDR